MKQVFVYGILSVILIFNACFPFLETIRGNGDFTTETRQINTFDGIQVNGSFDVDVVYSDHHSITIEAESNLIPLIETKIEAGKIVIAAQKGIRLRPKNTIKVIVTCIGLNNFNINGSGNIFTQTLEKSGNIFVNINGSGSFNGKILSNNVFVDISGSGKVDLQGNLDRAEYNISGSGKINALDCPTKVVKVAISGSGSLQVNAIDILDVDISGSGSVRFIGNPLVSSKISGSGTVRRL